MPKIAMQYRLSKTDNNTSGIAFFPANSYDPLADWARSDKDRRQKLICEALLNQRIFLRLG